MIGAGTLVKKVGTYFSANLVNDSAEEKQLEVIGYNRVINLERNQVGGQGRKGRKNIYNEAGA